MQWREQESGVTPRGIARRDRILDAATEVFLEQGFEAASVHEVVARAGGSLATLYKLFGSKEGLFEAMIERKASAVFGPLEEARFQDKPPEEALFQFGRRLIDLALSDDAIAIYRVVVSESHRNARLREVFWNNAIGRAERMLTDYFREQVARGHLRLTDCGHGAALFPQMVGADHHLRRVMGEAVTMDEEARDAVVRRVVAVFLYGCAARPGD